MHLEGVAIIPRCAECEANWLPADEAAGRRGSPTTSRPSSSSTAEAAPSGSSALTNVMRSRLSRRALFVFLVVALTATAARLAGS
jgi:hypothetical protein